MGQRREEKGYAHKCVTAIMALRIDDAAIAFATDYCAHLLHLGGNIDLAHCRCGITAAMTLGYITQGTRRAEIADCIAGRAAQHIVSHTYQSVLLAEHTAILADERQTVNVGVDHNAEVIATAAHLVHYSREILFQRFGIVREIACRFAVDDLILHTQFIKQFGQDDSSHTVYRVYAHAQFCTADGGKVDKLQCKHRLYMTAVVCIVCRIVAKMINIGIFKIFTLCYRLLRQLSGTPLRD